MLIFPLCDDFSKGSPNKEWVLVVVHVKQQKIMHYSAHGTNGLNRMEMVLGYMQQLHRAVFACDIPEYEAWRSGMENATGIPPIGNASDCGIFICLVAYAVLQSQLVDASANALNSVRNHLALETEAFLEHSQLNDNQ